MNRYLFLLAWVEESDGAGGELTGVREQNDLRVQYNLGNKNIFAVEILADNDDIAYTYGACAAMHDNYTAHDSVSNIILLDNNHKHMNPIVVIKASKQH